MKALVASSIGQYEKSVLALADYHRTVELGLAVCLRNPEAAAGQAGRPDAVAKAVTRAIVFGSDQGLVGQFNDVLADCVAKTLRPLPGEKKVWAVGDRVASRLADAGLTPAGLLAVPTSVSAITPLVGQVLLESEVHHGNGEISQLYLFHNRPSAGAAYEPVSQHLLPLDAQWRLKLVHLSWPTRNLPEVIGGREHAAAGADPGVYLCLSLQGVRRSVGSRKREPPGRHAASREKHRRPGGKPESDDSPPAADFHPLRIIRRSIRLRSSNQRSMIRRATEENACFSRLVWHNEAQRKVNTHVYSPLIRPGCDRTTSAAELVDE